MEFYYSTTSVCLSHASVSIPNGMEFYFINTTSNLSSLTGFQFPTGWNSTAELELLQRAGKSFNSQRDGILRLYTSFEADSSYVSIPNGMEFYQDGQGEARKGEKVSIANGMEFYFAAYKELRHPYEFQFPTGWNSTPYYGFSLRTPAFQFPTGWNSTQRNPNRYDMEYKVSIPNGMEFYAIVAKNGENRRWFQFPTGWNSTPIAPSQKH